MTPAGFIIEAGDSGRIIISRGSRGEEKVEEVEVRRRVEGEGAGEDWDALFFAGERERGDGNAGSGCCLPFSRLSGEHLPPAATGPMPLPRLS